MTEILAIAVDTPLRRTFEYRPPVGTDTETLRLGTRVRVPFGRRQMIGVLVAKRARSSIPAEKLRAAIAIVDPEPTFDPVLLGFLEWCAQYYQHPIGEVLAAAMPVALRRGATLSGMVERWRLTTSGMQTASQEIPARATRLRGLLDCLHDLGAPDTHALDAAFPGWREPMRTLLARRYVERQVEKINALPDIGRTTVVARPGPDLTAAQAAAVARINEHHEQFTTWLIDGVTGSGKTEVYLRLIEATLLRKRQALVLVPEIALTPQLTQRFADRFAARIVVLHSSLSDTERLEAWRAAREGVAPIVIGTRSAVFAPLAAPGLIIVDEEHDISYKQQEGFRYSGRDLAIARAQRHGIPVILGTATPALESLARAQRPSQHAPSERLVLPQRAGHAQPPRLELIDLRRHPANQGLSTPAMLAARRHLDNDGQVLLFLNRRGYAPALFCPGCGWAAPCPLCDARLTVHRRRNQLICHHCGHTAAVPLACPSCQTEVKPVGQGTERIEETLALLFPGTRVLRIDRDSMSRKGELETAMAQAARGDVRLLIGTQMLTKGHHFPGVTLVLVLNADQGLFGTDFRASERLAQTIVQVAGRAGRAERAGEVLIQTEFPDHPLLKRLLAGGYPAFAASALREREQAGWPPYSRLALVRADAASESAALAFLHAVRRSAPDHAVKLLGPASAPMQRRAGRFRAQLLVQCASANTLARFLRDWTPTLESLPEGKRVRWSLDVDPVELF